MAKFTIGGSRGQPLPRILNPLFFLFGVVACAFGAALCLFIGALMLLFTPFSFLTTIKMTHE